MTVDTPQEISNEPPAIGDDGSASSKGPAHPFVSRRVLTFLLPALIVTGLLAAGFGCYYLYSHRDDANVIEASGRIEAPETHISAPTATRVISVAVKEGDSVHKGQL